MVCRLACSNHEGIGGTIVWNLSERMVPIKNILTGVIPCSLVMAWLFHPLANNCKDELIRCTYTYEDKRSLLETMD